MVEGGKAERWRPESVRRILACWGGQGWILASWGSPGWGFIFQGRLGEDSGSLTAPEMDSRFQGPPESDIRLMGSLGHFLAGFSLPRIGSAFQVPPMKYSASRAGAPTLGYLFSGPVSVGFPMLDSGFEGPPLLDC